MRIEQISFIEQHILVCISEKKVIKILFKDLFMHKYLYENKQISKLISLIAH